MKTWKKWLVGVVAAFAFVAVAAGIGYYIKAKFRENYLDAINPEEAKNEILAGNLKDMTPEQRRAVLKKAGEKEGQTREIMRAENMSEEDKKIVRDEMRQIREEQMNARTNEYFALPQEQREAYLDKMIDDMQARFAEFAERRRQEQTASGPQGTSREGGQGSPQGGEQRQRRGPTMERIKERIETGTPEERAKQAQFRKELMERMKARGVNWCGRR